MPSYFHVTSTSNRASLWRFGLDWTRMGSAPGIAGSRTPEVEGCFLCVHLAEDEWFIRMNNTGGPVDVWEVSGVDSGELVESANGYCYVPRTVPPTDLALVRRDIPPPENS